MYQVCVECVRSVVASASSTAHNAKRLANRYFTAVELQDGTAFYLCHPYAELFVRKGGRLGLQYTKDEAHQYVPLVVAAACQLRDSGSDTDEGTEVDEDTHAGAGTARVTASASTNVHFPVLSMRRGETPSVQDRAEQAKLLALLREFS